MLRYIGTCLRAHVGKPYRTGFRSLATRTALAKGNERRD